ncbi:MAG: metal-dependent transcriptional regulator [Candidatus Latescibacteria bacterium]|nr:metal-dependent transcriptional regulator [Candidatus Latescibacterota bacterium]
MLSPAAEDYLKVVYKLLGNVEVVSTTAVSERMAVSAASVTNMMKKLAEMGLVAHTPYQGIALTDAGRKVALEIIRHHRLLELYLAEALGFGWDQVDAEAERLEHVISEEFEARMDEVLGYPTIDPHGDPIPTKDGIVDTSRYSLLVDAQPGQSVIVRRVPDSDPDMLRYLADLGLVPDATVNVIKKEPFNGPLLVKVGMVEHHIGHQVASSVLVDRARKVTR